MEIQAINELNSFHDSSLANFSSTLEFQEKSVDDTMKKINIRSKKNLGVLISILILIVLLTTFFIAGLSQHQSSRQIILRVDDIQDFAFKDGQLYLLKYAIDNKIPLSLAIIAGMFGEDSEILDITKKSLTAGSEACVHGWNHENFETLTLPEQLTILFKSKNQINEKLNVIPKVLIPPGFRFNSDTIYAMNEQSYLILSTCADFDKPDFEIQIKKIPATVELSVVSNGVWNMKNVDVLISEVENSFEAYGYAVIVTHPQEFISNSTLNQVTVDKFENLIKKLNENCYFTTFENIKFR